MHTVWKGAISFGLVHVPVKMFTATEDKDISLRMIHKTCGSPISYVKSCPSCETEVAMDEIVKGYEFQKGQFVLLDKEELESIGGERSKTITILDFVALSDIDPIYFQKTYYLSPDQAGSNAYQLLLESMRQTGKIGIAKVSIRQKSSLAAIRVMENALVMETIYYPDEIRSVSQVPGLGEAKPINEKELMMAKMLIEQLSSPFEPEKYTDDYRAQLMELIQHKIAGEEVRIAPSAEQTNVLDLMAALQASLEAARQTPAAEAPPAPAAGPLVTASGAEDASAAKAPAKRKARGGARKSAAAGDAAAAEPAAADASAAAPAVKPPRKTRAAQKQA
ncbi:non-homologous end joining protein Ku [Paenibacillus xylaniclasticus]|uniref:non-homologous end joining protein Ku n=1 Tax=Paenibacillus xylaniclasticus TaxID=588083 RepID=UPI000FDC1814|nr:MULTISPECIES: Ku protein [Paenibacillus]GFN29823.1 non-homologous end joining protein Ku [Paenibacillus curdlanolyticus]